MPADYRPPRRRGKHQPPSSFSSSPTAVSPSSPKTHRETLQYLEGAIEPASWKLAYPTEILCGPRTLFGEWRGSMLLCIDTESQCDYRDRVLTPDEQRVALPTEIMWAQRTGQLDDMRAIWAERLRKQQEETEATKKKLAARAKIVGRAPPPVFTHANDVPASSEEYRPCHCERYHFKCAYCESAAVYSAVDENQI